MKGLGVERAGAFVEQARRKAGDAGLALGILIGAAREGEVERDQRNGRVAHQPGLDAARALHPFDLHGVRRRDGEAHDAAATRTVIRRRAQARRSDGESLGDHRVHERFSSGSRLLDEIAGDRAALVEPLARRLLHGFGGDGAHAVGPGADIIDRGAGGQRRAVPVRQRTLIVLA